MVDTSTNPLQLLSELEEVLRTIPSAETCRDETPENHAWWGRAANIIERWNPLKGSAVGQLSKQLHARMPREAIEAFQQMTVLLRQAESDLRMAARASNLEGYLRQLQAQDNLIRESHNREIDLPVSYGLVGLFNEIKQAYPELNLSSFGAHCQPEVLRSQLAVAIQKISGYINTTDSKSVASSQDVARPTNPELVFVIHGRQLLGEFHAFLRALGLKPLEWSDARRRTGLPNPYTWEIVDRALREAGAIVALLTPDDDARLKQHLWGPHENAIEKEYLSQPRQNVLFEAGVAYGHAPKRTVLIRVGSHRPMSDLAGHHILQLDDSPQSRQDVADALRAAGCPVDVSGTDWFRAGKFALAEQPKAPTRETEGMRGEASQAKAGAAALLLLKTRLKGFTDLMTAAAVVTEIHSFFIKHPEYLNAANIAFLGKYPGDFRDKVCFDPGNTMKWTSLDELKHDVDLLYVDLGAGEAAPASLGTMPARMLFEEADYLHRIYRVLDQDHRDQVRLPLHTGSWPEFGKQWDYVHVSLFSHERRVRWLIRISRACGPR